MPSNPSTWTNFAIDDTDPRLQYSGDWTLENDKQAGSNTTHVTSTSGSSVTFSFNGTLVSAFTTIDQNGVHFAYSLDGGEQMYSSQAPSSPPAHRFPLLTIDSLQDREHNLTITSEVQPGEKLRLDYLTFTGHALPPLPEGTSDSVTHKPVHRTPPGLIVAIVIGTVAGLAVLTLLIYFASRRWHRLRISQPQHDISTKEKAFEIVPSQTELDERPRTGAVASKWILNGSRSAPSHGTTLPSSVFSSVIFNAPYSSTSGSRGTRSVF